METRRVCEERSAASRIQRIFRLNKIRRPIPIMTSFFVNPYSQVLDLSDKSHLKLYTGGCKGLDKELKFDGKRENYNNFVKLISQKLSNRKVKECPKIMTSWETSGTVPKQPSTIKDIFSTSTVTDDRVMLIKM